VIGGGNNSLSDFKKQFESKNINAYKQLNNIGNFTRDTENMANGILSKVENGEITVKNAQELFNKYDLVKDLIETQKMGELSKESLTSIRNKAAMFGI
jgi:hypothetical protein